MSTAKLLSRTLLAVLMLSQFVARGQSTSSFQSTGLTAWLKPIASLRTTPEFGVQPLGCCIKARADGFTLAISSRSEQGRPLATASFNSGCRAAGDAEDGVHLTAREKRYESKAPNYLIEIRYPEITGPDAGRGSKFNIEVADLIAKRMAHFKAQITEAGAGSDSGNRNTLTIDYHVTFSNGRLLSVAFPTEALLAPSGHRDYLTLCLTYDLRAGAGISMADIFKPETDFLHAMAEYCIPQLTAALGQRSTPDWIKKGASATGENYKVWNLTGGGIEITFDPGHVAESRFGVQKVVVPYSRLRPLVATGSPVFALT